MPPVTPAGYVSVERVRQFTAAPLDAVSDAMILRAILAGDSLLDKMTGRHWGQTQVVGEYHDMDKTLRTLVYPVISVETMEGYRGGSWEPLLEWNPDTRQGVWRFKARYAGIIEWVQTPSVAGRGAIRMNYTAGYAAVPEYIQDISMRLAAITTLQTMAGFVLPDYASVTEGALSISWGGYTGKYGSRVAELQKEVEAMVQMLGGRLDFAFQG